MNYLNIPKYFCFRSGEKYCINLGDDNNLPSCTCFDWKKHLIPCKHMLAIFKSTKESFLSLSGRYLNSPHLTIDYEEIGLVGREIEDETKIQDIDETVHSYATVETVEENDIFKDLPERKIPKLSSGNRCREVIKEIKSLSYLMDEEDLDIMEKELNDVLQFASSKVKKDNGFIIEEKRKRTISKPTKVFKINIFIDD